MINAINKFFANKSLKDIVSYLIYFLVFMIFPYIFDFYELLIGKDSDNEYTYANAERPYYLVA